MGCYTVDGARRLLGEKPGAAVAFARYGDSGADVETVGLLRFPSAAPSSPATTRSATTWWTPPARQGGVPVAV